MDNHRNILKGLGILLRRERVRRHLTQAWVADRVPLNIRTLQRAEAGLVNVRFTTFARITEVLHCPPDRLVPHT
ncbi:MAG: helix-turn-helix transcriptional regulator [Verrucomicrobia bacterium]|nr:helix-turn-helix transcriptional regulator [Verrucomicrobiota bacterium]